MLNKLFQFRSFIIFVGGISILALLVPFVKAQSKYPETISVLKTSYSDEVQALHTYAAYAQKAHSEGYPNIAHLFVALAASETVHARNFKKILSDLGAVVEKTPMPEISVSSTRKNLKEATGVELQEIDTKYPKFIQKIKPEKCEAAIQDITYAWKSEHQHRELLEKIRSATGMFFGLLAKKIEGAPADYFVCQRCGSTVLELPKDSCPICGSTVSNYKRV